MVVDYYYYILLYYYVSTILLEGYQIFDTAALFYYARLGDFDTPTVFLLSG
jgi:hypothetical protein